MLFPVVKDADNREEKSGRDGLSIYQKLFNSVHGTPLTYKNALALLRSCNASAPLLGSLDVVFSI